MTHNKLTIAVLGPGPKFKGGIANFTVSLCKSLSELGYNQVHLISWSQQYPFIIPRDFIDKESKSNPLKDQNVQVSYKLNYNNPLTWIDTASKIIKLKPAILVIQWAIALQGLPLGIVIRSIKKKLPDCVIIFDVHNVVQKENSKIDRMLTRFALEQGDKFVFHGNLTWKEFQEFFPQLKIEILKEHFNLLSKKKEGIIGFHPNYAIFDAKQDFDVEAFKTQHQFKGFVFLFFGFIRKYKGLHHTIAAFAEYLKHNNNATLVIAGESFWEKAEKKGFLQKFQNATFKLVKRLFMGSKNDETAYQPLAMIKELGIEKNVRLFNRFIANEEVSMFFKSADAVVNFYEYATPSGIESIAYQFGVQIVVSPVGHFDEAIVDGVNGYKAKSFEIQDLCNALKAAAYAPIAKTKIKHYGANFTWENYVKSIFGDAFP